MEVPQLYVKVIEASNLNLPFSHGTIRFVLSAQPLELKGTSCSLSNNPKWRDEEFVFHIQDHECDFCVTLVVEDKNKERIVRLSTATVKLAGLEKEEPQEKWFELIPIEKNYTMLYRESHIISSSAFSTLGPDVTHNNTFDSRDPQRVKLKLHYTFSQGTDLGATLALMQKPVSEFANTLLYDGTWLVNGLCEAIDITDTHRVAQSLVRVFEYYKNTRCLLRTVISKEVSTTESTGTLFRSNSMAMKLLSVYAQLTGLSYLRSTLAGPIADIVADVRSVEMDPSKLKTGENIGENSQHLYSLAQNVLDRILSSIDSVPREIRETCLFLHQKVTERFPEHWFIALGGFFFLRFICPACVAPEGAGVTSEVPTGSARRALVLVTKVLQQLANGQEFSGKEDYMKPMNSFIQANTPRLTTFFKQLVEIELDTSEESHMQLRPYMILNDLSDLHSHLKSLCDKIVLILTKNGAPNVETVQSAINNFAIANWDRKITKIHNITSEQLLQLGAIKLPSDRSAGLGSSGGMKVKYDEEIILNARPIYTGTPRDPNVVSEALLRMILALYTAHTLSCSHSSTDKMEDRWQHMAQADQFEVFKTDISELQKVNLDNLSELQLIAFFVNVFNTMSIHLHVNTSGNLMTRRTACLLLHKYRIGESEYSMIDILHILRGNPKNHITRHRHIRGGDVRRKYVLTKVDCRIHFALSYLTVTDPFIHVIHSFTVEEDLINAGMEFCQKHIVVDANKREVFLPEIFHKYASDFGMAKDDLFIWLFQYLSKETRIKLLELMEKKTAISFTPHSHEAQSIPTFAPSSPYSSGSHALATSPVSSPKASSALPLVRNDSAATIERYSNRVRSHTTGVPRMAPLSPPSVSFLTPPLPTSSSIGNISSSVPPSTALYDPTLGRPASIVDVGRSESSPNLLSKSAESIVPTPLAPLSPTASPRNTTRVTFQTPPSSPSLRRATSPAASLEVPNTTLPSSTDSHIVPLPTPPRPIPVKSVSTPSIAISSSAPSSAPSPSPVFLGCIDYYQFLPTSPPSTLAPISEVAPAVEEPKPEIASNEPTTETPLFVVPSEITADNKEKAKPIKAKSSSTVTTASSSRLAKSPSLSSASATSLMSSHTPSASPPAAPSSPNRKLKSSTSVSNIPSSPSPVLPSLSTSPTETSLPALKEKMVEKLKDISAFLRANMDTANRNVEYMMGLAQILTYMKKQFESPLHTTTGKFMFRTMSSLTMEPSKQETLISSVSKAVRLLREKTNEYRRVIEFENETMAVCSMKNICLDDIKEGMARFKKVFGTEQV